MVQDGILEWLVLRPRLDWTNPNRSLLGRNENNMGWFERLAWTVDRNMIFSAAVFIEEKGSVDSPSFEVCRRVSRKAIRSFQRSQESMWHKSLMDDEEGPHN
uniref:AlNc14C232G9306 protein n=1 Tax=Albugo laibachii Nc14 TaxID=890382 RepID=F0WSG4_9STRA|nr:AlNc14C232G9306 [Albugo laibachii Nc14]|eukprot:CCA24286.1 AlNc14C232G9306 [Albugo laibachii Nc14]